MPRYNASNVTDRLERDIKRLNSWMIGVIIVLAIAAGGALMTVMAQYQASYLDLRDEVKAQNDKIEALTKAIQDGQKAVQKTN